MQAEPEMPRELSSYGVHGGSSGGSGHVNVTVNDMVGHAKTLHLCIRKVRTKVWFFPEYFGEILN